MHRSGTTVSNICLGFLRCQTRNILVVVGGESDSGGAVLTSNDGGLNWAVQFVEGTRVLWAVAAHHNRITAVGRGLPITSVGEPITLPAADEYRFASNADALTFSWRYPPGVQTFCGEAYYGIVGSREVARPIGDADLNSLPSTDGRIGYVVSWSPIDRGISAGATFRYFVECMGVAGQGFWRQQIPEIQHFLLPTTRFDRALAWFVGRPPWQQVGLGGAGLLAVWCTLLVALWAWAPQGLVALYEKVPNAKVVDQLMDGADKLIAWPLKTLHLVEVAALFGLGTSRRALSAWVSARLPEARRQFTALKVVRDRRIALDLPVVLDGSRIKSPWSEVDALFRKPSASLLITGPAGAGKTTLACRIGCRALGEGGILLGGVPCLPLLFDRDLEQSEIENGLLPCLAGALRVMIDTPRLSSNLAEALVRSGYVLVIVDGLSERNEPTRRAFNPMLPEFPIMRMIMTSRDADLKGIGAVMETLAIPPKSLYSFIARYIDETIAIIEIETQIPYEGRRPSEADIHEACGQLKRLYVTNRRHHFLQRCGQRR